MIGRSVATLSVSLVAVTLCATLLQMLPGGAHAQSPPQYDTRASQDAILQQLLSSYPTSKATADGTDLVTAGAVLILQKDHLVMNRVDQAIPLTNVYKDGAISSMGGAMKGLGVLSAFVKFIPGAGAAGNGAADAASANATAMREFVSGEKFWVTRIDVSSEAVTFRLLSDPIREQRYHSALKIPFVRGAIPSPDEVAAKVAEVVKLDAPDRGNSAVESASNTPVPEPPVATKTIAIGQSRDEVIATFGVPGKIVQLGKKEIDYFPDMKVTFVANKVADVN